MTFNHSTEKRFQVSLIVGRAASLPDRSPQKRKTALLTKQPLA
jgi:hypothetical protein